MRTFRPTGILVHVIKRHNTLRGAPAKLAQSDAVKHFGNDETILGIVTIACRAISTHVTCLPLPRSSPPPARTNAGVLGKKRKVYVGGVECTCAEDKIRWYRK